GLRVEVVVLHEVGNVLFGWFGGLPGGGVERAEGGGAVGEPLGDEGLAGGLLQGAGLLHAIERFDLGEAALDVGDRVVAGVLGVDGAGLEFRGELAGGADGVGVEVVDVEDGAVDVGVEPAVGGVALGVVADPAVVVSGGVEGLGEV